MLSAKFSVPGPWEGQAAAFFRGAAVPSQTNEQDRRVAVPWRSLPSLTSRLCRAKTEEKIFVPAFIKCYLPGHQAAFPKGPDVLLHRLVITTTPPFRKQAATFHLRITGLKLIIFCSVIKDDRERGVIFHVSLV